MINVKDALCGSKPTAFLGFVETLETGSSVPRKRISVTGKEFKDAVISVVNIVSKKGISVFDLQAIYS